MGRWKARMARANSSSTSRSFWRKRTTWWRAASRTARRSWAASRNFWARGNRASKCMKRPVSFVDRLAPDTINQLERAARMRHDDAVQLLTAERGLGALYLFGYSVEMCLTAAYFRAFGLSPNAVIDRDTRQQRMAQARRLRSADGTPL